MAESKPPFAFISYRREDSAAAARYLFEMVGRLFGGHVVFLDVENVHQGDSWSERIEGQLEQATVVLAIIGPHWLRSMDEDGRRRIDDPADWVRRELSYALARSCVVIPVLLLDTAIPRVETLDEPLRRLPAQQALRLRDDSWHDDLVRLMARLDELGFARAPTRTIRYPTPRIHVRELSVMELKSTLARLTGWCATPNERGGSDLYKVFEFASFENAMSFMQEAAEHARRAQHHPRWENLWRTVTVWLSTWDIGSRISPLDVELAIHFEEARAHYPQAPATPMTSSADEEPQVVPAGDCSG